MRGLSVVLTIAVLSVLPVLPASARPDAPATNGRISFDSFRDGPDVDIWTMDPDGSDPVNLTADSPGADFAGSWSFDGERIVFLHNPEPNADDALANEIWVMRADGSGRKQITHNAVQEDWPSWSPSGRHIVFQRDPDGDQGPEDGELWVMRADGSRERQITDNEVDDNEPVWSPNGRRIAFSKDADPDPEGFNIDVFDVRPNGRRERRLTVADGFDGGPDYSPDGKHIAFDSERDGDPDVWVMERDGDDPRQLTGEDPAEGALDILAAWSPDGRFIAFDTNRDSTAEAENQEIYSMRADGSGESNLTANPAFDAGADWQPIVADKHHGHGHHGDHEDDEDHGGGHEDD